MSFKDYSHLSEKEILIDLAGKVEHTSEKIDTIGTGVSELRECNEDIERRLAEAEQITKPLGELKQWSGRAVLLMLLVALGTALLAARHEITNVFNMILRYSR